MIIGKILFWLIVVYVAFCAAMFMSQRSMMYFPSKDFPDIPPMGGADFIRVITSDGLDIYGWYHPAKEGNKTIVYFHGNAGSIANRFELVQPYLQEGYGVLLAGYRGYGGNNGKPSEEGLYQDGRSYVDFLKAKGVEESEMVFYGESLGSGVAVQLAGDYPNIAALALVTPYSSILDVATKNYFFLPVQWLLRDRYLSDQKIGALTMPKFFFVAGSDEIIAPEFARKLYDAAPQPKSWHDYPGAGHNTIYDEAVSQDLLADLQGL